MLLASYFSWSVWVEIVVEVELCVDGEWCGDGGYHDTVQQVRCEVLHPASPPHPLLSTHRTYSPNTTPRDSDS